LSADHSLALRQAVIAALRTNAPLAALVGQAVYERVPNPVTWPYLRYGVDILSPYEATGTSGGDLALTIHVFAKGPASDQARQIVRAVHVALDGARLALFSGFLIDIAFTGSQLLEDQSEPNAYHGIVQFDARTGEEK
jgi:hypothetical protein